MKNYVKKITCLLLGVLTAASSVMVTACKDKPDSSSSDSGSGGKEQVHNTETRPVVFATDALDGNFNPFFATSATDSTIAAITQVGMLSSDKDGKLTYGKDEPTVVLDYKETMKDSNKQVTTNAAEAADGGTTEYEFIIKNGLKFSDGEPLTIKDVLFNLYVYLDPYYMGSATLYSTDIQGLKAYRAQDPDLQDDSDADLDTKFYAKADQRISDLLEYLDPEDTKPELTAQIEKDIARVKELFVEEAQSDWTLAAGTQESYKEEYTFTEDWQIYYFREGIVKVPYVQGVAQKDKDGKYITSLDLEDNELTANIEEVKSGKNNDKEEYTLEYWKTKEFCSEEEAAELAVQAYAIDQVIDANTSTDGALANVIRYWATGSNARDDFAAEARSKYFKENGGKVESISGIQQSTTTKDFSGNDLGETHDVLKIVINGVDPKAKWNFAFSVAPMRYYSNEEAIATTKYGVKFSDKEFFDTVLQDPEKNGLPVGAGVYKATNESDSGNVNKNNFYRNNRVYFARNEYFYTMLGDGTDTSNNAKIKYMQYRVVSSNRIMQALESEAIDFGAPQATKDNIEEIGNYAHILAYRRYRTNGYGYVGINPKFVPDIEVRRAIMKAMNTAMIVTDYYTSELADVIYRPMSLESWAYPNGVEEYENIAMTRTKSEIQDLLKSAHYEEGEGGVWVKDGKKLEITFTIAGESVDHPAYDMFQDAAKFLNTCGFKISVTTDITALKKLATGGLAVWAAAWSTTIDPDLYQIYHKDSKATSVKNWGYSTIYADTTGQFNYEKTIIDDLSVLIEEGRATLNQKEREEIYAEALDLIMELAVELPTYQRNDLVVYNRTVIDASTLNQTPTANAGVYDRLWEVNYL